MRQQINFTDSSLGLKLSVQQAYKDSEHYIVLIVDHSKTRADIPEDPGSGPFIWMINTWIKNNGLLYEYTGEGQLFTEHQKMLQPGLWEFHLGVTEPSDIEFFISNLS